MSFLSLRLIGETSPVVCPSPARPGSQAPGAKQAPWKKTAANVVPFFREISLFNVTMQFLGRFRSFDFKQGPQPSHK